MDLFHLWQSGQKYSFISNHFEEHKADSNMFYSSTIEEIALGVIKQIGV